MTKNRVDLGRIWLEESSAIPSFDHLLDAGSEDRLVSSEYNPDTVVDPPRVTGLNLRELANWVW